MNSPLLALFVRSLREDARGKATYWTRGGLGGFLLFILFSFASSNTWTNAPGRAFFTGVIILQLVAVTFVGLSYFASAITEEKEEQTLGLLRMAQLSPLSILLGKSTSRLCGALLLLLGQVPFSIFAITLGGVSLGQVAAVYCTLLAYTFFLCNLALLGSVLARSTGGAALFCVLVFALLALVDATLPAVQEVANHFGAHLSFDPVTAAIWASTPIARLGEVFEAGFDGCAIGWQVLSNLAGGVGCFLLAWAVFERFCDHVPDGMTGDISVSFSFFRRVAGRPPRAWRNALAWKDFYFHCGGRWGFGMRTLGYGGVLIMVICNRLKGLPDIAEQFLFWIFFAFSIDIAGMAAQIFRREIHDRTLAGLASLPDSMQEIVNRKTLGYMLAAAPGAIAAMAIQIYVFVAAQTVRGGMSRSSAWTLALFIFGAWMTTILLVHFVEWLSLRMKRGALPLGYAITVFFSTAMIGVGLMIVGAITSPFVGQTDSWEMLTAILVMIMGLLISGGVCLGISWTLRECCIFRLEDLAAED